MAERPDTNRERRGIAILVAGVGLGWILVTAIGAEYGWSQRLRALFDLAALAGFGVAIWKIIGQLRARRDEKE